MTALTALILVIFYRYMNTTLANKLQKMAHEDQEAIRKRQQKGVVNTRIFKTNTKKMEGVIARFGWPTISLVGAKGSKNAWLIVQHSDGNLRFQKKCLQLMLAKAKKNPKDIIPMQIAFLTDRILTNEKKTQKFGTQFYWNKKGEFTYWPIRDIRNVDERRATYGIGPLAEYIKSAKSFTLAPIKKILK